MHSVGNAFLETQSALVLLPAPPFYVIQGFALTCQRVGPLAARVGVPLHHPAGLAGRDGRGGAHRGGGRGAGARDDHGASRRRQPLKNRRLARRQRGALLRFALLREALHRLLQHLSGGARPVCHRTVIWQSITVWPSKRMNALELLNVTKLL